MAEQYDKLVRDRIPELIEADGDRPVTHTAGDEEFDRRLREKLVEEATEIADNGRTAELADVQAVLNALCAHRGVSDDELTQLVREKAERRGGFDDRIVLDRVEQ